jgi:hypothetical protein
MNATRRGLPPWRPLAAAVALALLIVGACQWAKAPVTTDPAPEAAGAAGPPFFADVTANTGIDFTYRNGEEAGHYAILESLGGGVALIDYDGDGLLDIFLPGGGYYDGPDKKQIRGHPCKLYRNLGGFKFQDVTAQVGLGRPWFYSHGAAVGDFNRDGWPDLLVTGWGRLALFRNDPADPKDPTKGRKFTDVTAQAKLPTGLWSTSAGWADLDGDGLPDLYVCQYVDWSFDSNHPTDCKYDGKTRDVCPPKRFKGLPHKLYRNNGDGTFADVSKEAGLRGPRAPEDYAKLTWLSRDVQEVLRRGETEGDTRFGKGLGVILVDVNGDGKPDVYVANDTVDNFLYMNRRAQRGQLRFEERGMETGTARDDLGNPNGSMGLAAGDPFGTGRPALWVTNYENELNALYRNDCIGNNEFLPFATKSAGLAAHGQDTVGWGTAFVDLDHDGWEDLFYVTGHAIRHPPRVPRAQRAGLYLNTGAGKFTDARARGGVYFDKKPGHVARGAAFGDLDNDGNPDVVISHINEPVVVLRNLGATGGRHWLGVELDGKDHADVVGARVVLEGAGHRQTRFAVGGGSYASASDRRHVFGLGNADGRDLKLTVVWPSGKQQEYKIPAVDRYWLLTEGAAEARPPRGAAK